MERSFEAEVEQLKLGAGRTFHGEGILAVTKALLQSGVSYVGGYQGARCRARRSGRPGSGEFACDPRHHPDAPAAQADPVHAPPREKPQGRRRISLNMRGQIPSYPLKPGRREVIRNDF